MTILFISRAYPPVTGGIENQNAALAEWLPKHAETTTVANRLGRRFLPFFMPYALLRALWLMRRHDVLLLGDGVLGIVGYCVKHCYPKKTVVSVLHGLDLTYTLPIYQRFWVKVFLPALDGFIAVGNRTIEVAVERGLRADRCIFVPNGVNTEKHLRGFPRTELEQLLVRDLSKCGVLLTSGRLAKRKGVAWFIRNVLPLLPPSVLYVVAGDGVDRENIQTTIRETSQTGRVFFLGYVNNRTRDLLFNTCDIFIQPNIHVDGDMEGFGLTVLEAGSCRLPVIAALVLAPAVTFATVEFLLLPRLTKKLNAAAAEPVKEAAEPKGEKAGKEGKEGKEGKDNKEGYEFTSVVVNLSGTMGTRYLKTSFLVTGSDAGIKEIFEGNKPRLTDVTLNVLSSLSLADLEEPGAKNVIREKLVTAYNQALGRRVAEQVYFSDFVVQ